MSYIPEDINNLCYLLIEHYGEEYINDWDTLTELIYTEFDIIVSSTDLAAMQLDSISYMDKAINLKQCGVNY